MSRLVLKPPALRAEIVDGEVLWVDDTSRNYDGMDTMHAVKEPDGWYEALIKEDGCVEINRYFNIPAPEVDDERQLVDFIHVCSIDDFIKRLEALKVVAKERFGEEWRV